MVPEHPVIDWTAMTREAAVPALLERHGGRLYGLGQRLCGNDSDAEDLVQETFLRAWNSWDAFEGRADPGTWLWTIAARVCSRMRRRRQGEPGRLASLDAMPAREGAIGVPPSDEDGPLDAELRREAREQIASAIVDLPEDYRMPLVLKEVLGFPVATVASMLSMNESTVKTRLRRGRLRLRDALEHALPRRELPPLAYPERVCMDLLEAKQEAMDHGRDYPSDEVVCERCLALFRTLDLSSRLCRELATADLPPDLRARLLARLEGADPAATG